MNTSTSKSTPSHAAHAVLSDPYLLRRKARMLADAVPQLSPQGALYSAFLRGNHGRRKAGSGDSFWQFRTYAPGDPASAIDWRRSARSDGTFVRQYEWEAARDVWIICDMGGHMHFSGTASGPTKAEQAGVLAVALAHLFTRGGERVGLFGFSERPLAGKYGTDMFAEKIVDAGGGVQSGRIPQDLTQFAPPGPGTYTLWLSDFLSPIAQLRQRIRAVSRAGTTLHMVQILDPSEETFPFDGRIQFEGPSRTDGHLIENAADIKARYLRRLARHQDEVSDAAREVGAQLLRHRTNRSLTPTLIALTAVMGNC
ncbi:MAG: DUF58 domain-containing protein [Pseudomonadota bacterium]